jgi:hypothetical protein
MRFAAGISASRMGRMVIIEADFTRLGGGKPNPRQHAWTQIDADSNNDFKGENLATGRSEG